MISEAIDRILKLAEIRKLELNGATYASDTDRLQRVKPSEHYAPTPLVFSNLDSLISYIETNPDNLNTEGLRLHVVNRLVVELIGPLQTDNDNARFCYARATFDPTNFHYDVWMPIDEFIVSIQSAFVQTDQSDAVVNMLANIANEAIRTSKDDGFSQTISIKTGLTTKSEVTVRNPVELVPITTFREVEQPAGQFILRLKDHGGPPLVCLFAADVKALQLAGAVAVAKYLIHRLEEDMLETRVLF